MDSHGELHPNWRALATIHIPLKRFLREGVNDLETGAVDKKGQKYEIKNINGKDAKEYYESITRTEKPTEDKTNKTKDKLMDKKKEKPKREVIDELKKPFNQNIYFRFAMENNAQGLKEFQYTVNELNSCDAFGWTALMMAACEGAEEAVRMLLQLGVKKELCDRSGKTALDLARSKGLSKIVEVLENYGNIDESQQINENDQTPDADSLPVEPFYCEICKRNFKDSNYKQHLTSTVHQFNTRSTCAVNKLNKFNIPPKNRGLQLMVKQGWDKESGLGPTSSGRLYPVKTVIRKVRTGLGIEQEPARVTHFEAFDLRATKSKRSDYYKKKPRNQNDIRREKQRNWKREKRLRTELS